jgi:protocatechuate 3,4-dioxygenase beta subunit
MTRELSRREALAGFGAVSLGALLAACSDDEGPTRASTAEVTTSDGDTATVQPRSTGSLAELFDDSSACRLTPEATEGPYYFDADAIRSDIREGRKGAALRLAVRVRDSDCKPLENAVVDIWHCDAVGIYSGFESASRGAGGGRGGSGPTDEETFLRGAQVTDADGIVQFRTVYPGWYMGRTTHIHAKVHVDRQTMLTTQLYFDDDYSARIYRQEPYASRADRATFNDDDGLFDTALLLKLSRDGDGHLGLISFDLERA